MSTTTNPDHPVIEALKPAIGRTIVSVQPSGVPRDLCSMLLDDGSRIGFFAEETDGGLVRTFHTNDPSYA